MMRMEQRITIEQAGSVGWRKMVALRDQVLRAPLGLTFTDKQLAAETGQIHLALWLQDMLAGTLLLLPPDPEGEAKLRQMAVRPGLERQGFGTLLVRHGEAELRRLGATGARLAARASAIGFYARLGYIVEGAPFMEVTLPHRTMRKPLL
jgi:ribosomal protein S18 acetylase RimI-like enzyme